MTDPASHGIAISDEVVDGFIAASEEKRAEARRDEVRQALSLVSSMTAQPICDMDALYALGDGR